MLIMGLPIAFIEPVRRALHRVRVDTAIEPSLIEVRFGAGSMEELGRELLSKVTSIKRIEGVDVRFPEEPSNHLGVIEVRVLAQSDSPISYEVSLYIAAGEVITSR